MRPTSLPALGTTFGKLTVTEHLDPIAKSTKRVYARVTVRCACGSTRVAYVQNLRSGNTTSCGCLRASEAALMGLELGSNTAEYRVWDGMWHRCSRPGATNYPGYGGRGITVCERWKSFRAFMEDMGSRPSPRHSIDRKDNDGNYEPGNCRWATSKEQAANRRPPRRKGCGLLMGMTPGETSQTTTLVSVTQPPISAENHV